MRVKLKRVLSFVSAVVICGFSCVTAWFSVPVSAIGVFSPFNLYQLYQMLHGLLLGDGGGNSQTFGEWLEKNMTQTIGSGNDKHVFLLTPGEKLEDMMSEASIRLALGAACTDGGIAGVSKMKDLIDSWTEVYDASDIGEIGDNVFPDVGLLPAIPSGFSTYQGISIYHSSSPSYAYYPSKSESDPFVYFRCPYSNTSYAAAALVGGKYRSFYCLLKNGVFYWRSSPKSGQEMFSFTFQCYSSLVVPSVTDITLTSGVQFGSNAGNLFLPASVVNSWLSALGVSDYGYTTDDEVIAVLSSSTPSDYTDISGTVPDSNSDFIGPVYAMPAAKQLVTDTGTLSGLRLDVQTEDGTPDISAALDHAGVDSVNDLVSGVASGTIPMSQVYEDMRVVPYVLTDVETGQVVTDLNVSATDVKTKAVALDKTLSIPKDVSAADAYQVTGKTWDPEMSKYKLPLFQFFPFCLPWDIYEVLTLFDAEPVAPKFTIPVGQFFTRFSGSVDTSEAADQKAVVDLGSDSWQSTFKVIRALECAAIIIGLCLTAVLLIHGGR